MTINQRKFNYEAEQEQGWGCGLWDSNEVYKKEWSVEDIQLKREEAEAENWWGSEDSDQEWTEEEKELKRVEQQELMEELRNEDW